jgi:2-polyprenyl-6-methoxyphenol hydroxylase-like FAD-dependent oxidoreductase
MSTNVKLNVVVVGGGIGGLTAALALRRQGHTVTVLESSSHLREVGAAVAVPPNATRALIKSGIDLITDAKGTLFRNSLQYHFKPDEVPKFGESGQGRQLPWSRRVLEYRHLFYLTYRVDLHNALKNKCLGSEGPGEPVDVRLASRVVAWDSAGSVKLHNGEKMSADLIVAADGVHSIAHECILGYMVPAVPSGITATRFVLRTEDILNDPSTAPMMDDGDGCFTFYGSSDNKVYLLRYPCHKYNSPPSHTRRCGKAELTEYQRRTPKLRRLRSCRH